MRGERGQTLPGKNGKIPMFIELDSGMPALRASWKRRLAYTIALIIVALPLILPFFSVDVSGFWASTFAQIWLIIALLTVVPLFIAGPVCFFWELIDDLSPVVPLA